MSIAGKKTGPEPADIETASDAYAGRFSGPQGAWMLERQRRMLFDLLDLPASASILDVGGGHAQIAVPMMEAGFRVTVHGSDPVCAARIRPHLDAGRMEFVCAPMFALPFPDRAFDAVTCIRLLPHCPEWPDLVRELCRVARRAVVVDYPTWRSVNVVSGLLFGMKKKVEGNTRPFRLFTHNEVRRAFEQHGFRVAVKRGQFVFPMALHRIMKSPGVSGVLESTAAALGLARLAGSPVLLKAVRREGGDV